MLPAWVRVVWLCTREEAWTVAPLPSGLGVVCLHASGGTGLDVATISRGEEGVLWGWVCVGKGKGVGG